jgi:hypothetical protein
VPLKKASVALLSAQLEDMIIRILDKFGASARVFPTLSRVVEILPLPYSEAIQDMKKNKLLPMGCCRYCRHPPKRIGLPKLRFLREMMALNELL